ncbi:MAG TPA: hypothetical protein VLR26_10085, partial [Frankiaceae bacterium]|nr:hypothetical protein [Frankiaceae bacterium]
MNGLTIPLDHLPAGATLAVPALLDQFDGWQRLDSWRSEEVSRLAAYAGVESRTIPYAEWSTLFPHSAEASRDAYLRLRGVDPSWVVATFPVLTPDAVFDPAGAERRSADVGQSSLDEKVHPTPGPNGHDVKIGVGRTGWYDATCREIGCYWSFRSMAFPLMRWHAERHHVDASATRQRRIPPRCSRPERADVTLRRSFAEPESAAAVRRTAPLTGPAAVTTLGASSGRSTCRTPRNRRHSRPCTTSHPRSRTSRLA